MLKLRPGRWYPPKWLHGLTLFLPLRPSLCYCLPCRDPRHLQCQYWDLVQMVKALRKFAAKVRARP